MNNNVLTKILLTSPDFRLTAWSCTKIAAYSDQEPLTCIKKVCPTNIKTKQKLWFVVYKCSFGMGLSRYDYTPVSSF